MEAFKNILGIAAVLLTFIGYIPYIRDTLSGKTRPHIYSWFIWALVTAIAFALQITSGGGIGSYVTLAAAIVSFYIFILGLRGAKQNIKNSDKVFLALSLAALVIWLFAKQPLISVILVSFIDMLGFAPTIRKSWKDPYSETLVLYQINTFRFILGTFALANFTVITMLYPVTWLLANGLFSIMLIIRRRQIKKRS
jgi:hypothetical protein